MPHAQHIHKGCLLAWPLDNHERLLLVRCPQDHVKVLSGGLASVPGICQGQFCSQTFNRTQLQTWTRTGSWEPNLRLIEGLESSSFCCLAVTDTPLLSPGFLTVSLSHRYSRLNAGLRRTPATPPLLLRRSLAGEASKERCRQSNRVAGVRFETNAETDPVGGLVYSNMAS